MRLTLRSRGGNLAAHGPRTTMAASASVTVRTDSKIGGAPAPHQLAAIGSASRGMEARRA
jgi:hypothetical protein